MRRLTLLALTGLLTLALCVPSTSAERDQTLAGQTFTGTFVTMTKGAKCPSTSSVDFMAEGSATGPVEGVYNERGSLRVTYNEGANVRSIAAYTSHFDINARSVTGEIMWDREHLKPLALSCDPLSLRIEGTVRYKLASPSTEAGTAVVQILGSRNVVTEPYFGKSVVSFTPDHAPAR
jgi:hypothetical protein